jgi:hypothetical protein
MDRFFNGLVYLIFKSLLYLDDHLFLKICEIFCGYFIEYIYFLPLASTSSPFSMPAFYIFDLLMVSQRSCMLFVLSYFFPYPHLNVLIHVLFFFTPWYSVFSLILSIDKDFNWFFYLIHWVFHFQKFNLIFSQFPYLYCIHLSYSILSSLFHLTVYLYSLGIHSGVYLCPIY